MNQKLSEIVQVNLTSILNNQTSTRDDISFVHANLKGIAKREAERFVKDNPQKLMEELDKISIYSAEYLNENVKGGN